MATYNVANGRMELVSHPTNIKALAHAHAALDRVAAEVLQANRCGTVGIRVGFANGYINSVETERKENERPRDA